VRFEQRSLSSDAEQRAATVAGQLERMRPATFEHSRRVATLAVRVARHARIPAPLVSDVYWGALVHDIGELNIRRSLLDAPTSLTEKEHAQMSRHTIVGARWLAAMPGLAPLVPYARWHHERFDGLGYPDGCAGDRVPLTVALVGVCDAWDAMTEPRPYREPLSVDAAAAEMRAHAGRQWSRALVDWLLETVGAPAEEAPPHVEPGPSVPDLDYYGKLL
jgi:HD-GYP domain-containing protein (c-di-GMP phosphodiesterase class II)